MSDTLLIRHLCGDLEVSERTDFLKYFGAQKVWFINPKSHTAFASFVSKEAAENALHRLHQLEVLGKRLTVEYANGRNAPKSNVTTNASTTTSESVEYVKEFIEKLNSTNHYLGFTQPPPPNINYKYPPATPQILLNILYSLAKNVAFYTQTLHLMNKFSLDPPFGDISQNVREYFQNCMCDIGINLENERTNNLLDQSRLSSDESEMSYQNDERPSAEITITKPVKRRSKLKRINKKVKLYLGQPALLNLKCSETKKIPPNEVFEDTVLPKTTKIEIKVNSTLNESLSVLEPSDIGTIGKMETTKSNENPSALPRDEDSDSECVISTKELLSNKIPIKDMKLLSVFKNYQVGAPSMRLYIKNLAKDVTEKDVKSIYRRYIISDNNQEINSFDVRVMQEGKMKGQAFVTLPSIEASQQALNETNGFILKNKPMVVQFARTANK